MFQKSGDYQRLHLRAPFREEILYVSGSYAHKARAINISEGGLLLENVPHFPAKGETSFALLSLPQYPLFKNFTLEKLLSFNQELFPKKCARVTCEVLRKEGESEIDQVFAARVGCRFSYISDADKKNIAEFVDTFSGNLIFLQVLLDNAQADKEALEKARVLAEILHYDAAGMKLSLLRKKTREDYLNLKWL